MFKPELQETKVESLPIASLETLKALREEMCSQSVSRDFKIQNHQRFLRRILSPDSSTRSLLMVHGTGTGKTCSAIQIAEEYIIRPEFQDSKVLVIANPVVQDNFKKQIFDESKIYLDKDDLLLSKQCTGRRYLEMLQRIQKEPLKWSSKQVREKMNGIANKLIEEFYEFQGYTEFSNKLENETKLGNDVHVTNWIHKTFDNRMIIIDEAHNLKVEEGTISKLVSKALQQIIKTAHNVTLILLTATPMFDTFDEIIFYINLFLWNDRKQDMKTTLQPKKIFHEDGTFQEGMETVFRGWCQDYISFVRGDNPFTFPFRLPPPDSLIAEPAVRDYMNEPIKQQDRRKVLTLTKSVLKGIQLEVVKTLKPVGATILNEIICVLPENAPFSKVFTNSEGMLDYADKVPKFLAPSKVHDYSCKFSTIMKTISESTGIVFVFSNLKEYGANLFAMCLEEHGYEHALDKRMLKTTSGEISRGSKGKYALFSSDVSGSEQNKLLSRLKRKENMNGEDIKVIIGTPTLSEGVDLANVRQVHVLDYWWNMSRIEQVVGRGIRTCSHKLLPFEEQNCTVYLHICKYEDPKRETIDEYYYRAKVEKKSDLISKVKQTIMESAMDCPLQSEINTLPKEWRNLSITQKRSQDSQEVTFTLAQMASPVFGEEKDLICNVKEIPLDPNHERPLSSYVDVRDEILDKLLKLFHQKPIWLKQDLLKTNELKSYDPDLVIYTIQNAIETGFVLKNVRGQHGFLSSRKNYYTFTLTDRDVAQDLITKDTETKKYELPILKEIKETKSNIDEIIDSYKWITNRKFSREVLEWYIVDHVLDEDQRLEHMINLDWDNPPIYAKPLIISKDIHVLGSNNIYKGKEKITLFGDTFDMYVQWVIEKKNKFVGYKGYFAFSEKKILKFNLDPDSKELKRVERIKVIAGRACTNFTDPVLNQFVEWLDGTGFPKETNTKPKRCQYVSLIIREAVLKNKEGIIWWTPEEWSIFMEDSNKKDLLSKLK